MKLEDSQSAIAFPRPAGCRPWKKPAGGGTALSAAARPSSDGPLQRRSFLDDGCFTFDLCSLAFPPLTL